MAPQRPIAAISIARRVRAKQSGTPGGARRAVGSELTAFMPVSSAYLRPGSANRRIKIMDDGLGIVAAAQELRPAVYPFTAIVGQDELKDALLAAAVNPLLGGVLILGHRG